ncbi:hypothetical protein ACIOTI_09525 [Streptomyces sp. NPDC087843]|uniref:hypothetical protein n=2 Tax=unclassified Streptomyces TaxID=2593676 RepID=UPI0037FBC2EB
MVKRVRQGPPARRAKAVRDATPRSRLTTAARSARLWLRELGGRTLALLAGAVIVVAAVAVTGYFLSRTETARHLPDTRARSYKDVDACLLTGKDGITAGTTAAQVWEGMQDASLTTRARVSYVTVTGEQSAAHARPYLNSLLQRSCDVVLAAGRPQVEAAEQAAPQHRTVDFVLVGDSGSGSEDPGNGTKGTGSATNAGSGKDPGNITFAPLGDGLRAEVAHAVERQVGTRG